MRTCRIRFDELVLKPGERLVVGDIIPKIIAIRSIQAHHPYLKVTIDHEFTYQIDGPYVIFNLMDF